MRVYFQHAALLLFSFLFLSSSQLLAQEPSSYRMELLRAVRIDSAARNQVWAVFKITPTVNDFKLIMSMRLIYSFGQDERSVDLMKQKKNNVRTVVYGSTLEKENKPLYGLIKNQVDFEKEKDVYILLFAFEPYNEKPDHLSITYGLWESTNPDVRHEKKYEAVVEAINGK